MGPLLIKIVSIVVPLGFLGIAAWGLGEWKRHLKGKTEFDTAKDTLLAVYMLRNAISTLRQPSELDRLAEVKTGRVTDPSTPDRHLRDMYLKGRQNMMKSLTDLQLQCLIANVHWPNKLDLALDDIRGDAVRLNGSFNRFFHILEGGKSFRELKTEGSDAEVQSLLKIVYRLTDETDDFGIKVDSSVKQFESLLNQYLRPE